VWLPTPRGKRDLPTATRHLCVCVRLTTKPDDWTAPPRYAHTPSCPDCAKRYHELTRPQADLGDLVESRAFKSRVHLRPKINEVIIRQLGPTAHKGSAPAFGRGVSVYSNTSQIYDASKIRGKGGSLGVPGFSRSSFLASG
jgi:hypothetical protein